MTSGAGFEIAERCAEIPGGFCCKPCHSAKVGGLVKLHHQQLGSRGWAASRPSMAMRTQSATHPEVHRQVHLSAKDATGTS